ncbi:glucose-6-phosphate isomerase [Candidatus Protochlamydia phocaeensis]|uniref:glucose-6-phosphate isomerase n=1 Tax=Candidatus Protochlamydia phocaeensis TaxID=1414722 RepID=UPI000AD9D7AB|nr:glucose-6-phosphate isomerase [Candidatus Protochlamydia phocaeensis]
MSFVKEGRMAQQQPSFLNYPAAEKLQALAQNPIDLAKPGQLTPERLATYCSEACGFKLLYGTEKVTDEVMQALQQLAQEAQVLKKMNAMQNGEIVNHIEGYPSENRPALHTATRDFFEEPRTAPKAKEAALLARQEIDKLKSFLSKIEVENRFDDIISVGIGGSDLGPRANFLALEHLRKAGKRVHFISNVDPDDAAGVLKQVKDLKRTLVLVISKSGTTLETAINEELVCTRFKEAHLNPQEHFVAITMPGTPMDNRKKYLEVFHLWDWIGGRYSTTSMCGAVILSFAFGFDVFWEFLRGAHAMDLAALQSDLHKNLPLLAALLSIWNRNFLNYPTLALIPYSQALLRYPAHIQQVEMESNGKRIDQQGQSVNFQTGPVIWGEPGTNAQHSFFQLLHQGTAVIPVCMVGFKKSQYGKDLEIEGTTSQEKLLANLFAQSLALATGQTSDNPNKFFPGNRPTHILLGEQLTPFALGAFLSFFENKVAFEGFIWGINSFDQEGVQLGKVLSNKIIERFAAQRDQAQDRAFYPLGDAYLKHLEHFH